MSAPGRGTGHHSVAPPPETGSRSVSPPPETGSRSVSPTERHSVAFPRRYWYPVCQSGDLGSKPVGFELMETPLVAFRGAGGVPAIVLDRCPHRNVPLHLGSVTDGGTLQCGYHGWCFDGGGECTRVPGLQGDPAAANRSVAWHAAAEADGFIWVWGEPEADPETSPPALPDLRAEHVARRTPAHAEGKAGVGSAGEQPARARRSRAPYFGRTVFECDMATTMHAAIENALDVPHTAFLHGGIFRGNKAPREITAVRREIPGGVEVQYLGEPIGFGPLTLSAEQTSKTFDHWDRFLLPHTAQIEYHVEGWLQIVNTILHLPLGPFRTRAWFVLDHALPIPAAIASPIIKWQGRRVLAQDVSMLEAQTRWARRFGGERYTSTELDLLGNAIWRLLRRAERAEGSGEVLHESDGEPAEPVETTVTLRI